MHKRARKITVDTGQFLRSIAPVARPSPSGPTGKDVANNIPAAAIAVIVTWLLHDVVGLDAPGEVYAALGSVVGYAASRLLRY